MVYCVLCKKEIKDGERRYYSRQKEIEGLSHWDCFVKTCRLLNKGESLNSLSGSAGNIDGHDNHND